MQRKESNKSKHFVTIAFAGVAALETSYEPSPLVLEIF